MYSKEKYKMLFEKLDDKNGVILYLLSRDKMSADALCALKVGDVNEKGIGGIELPKREMASFARYIKAAKAITSAESWLFSGRGGTPLTPAKIKISLTRACKETGVTLDEVDVSFKGRKEDISEDNVNMNFVMGIIQDKLAQH